MMVCCLAIHQLQSRKFAHLFQNQEPRATCATGHESKTYLEVSGSSVMTDLLVFQCTSKMDLPETFRRALTT